MRRLLAAAFVVLLSTVVAGQEPSNSGTMTATDATVSLVTPLAGTITITITGAGYSATTLFERTNDGGTTWSALDCLNVSSGALVTSTTTNGTFLCVGGGQRARTRTNPYTSGTVSAAIYMSQGPSVLELARALPTGTNTVGGVNLSQYTPAAGRLPVDGSGVTQPVSGTVTTTPPVNASTNVAQFGGTNVSTGTGTGGAGIPRVTVSSDSTVTANAGTNLNTSALALDATVGLAQGSTTSGQKGPLAQAAVTTGNPAYTTAQTSPLSLDLNGGLRVSIISGAGSGGTALADRAAFTYGTTSFTPGGGVYNSSITALTSGQAGVAALTPNRKTHVALFDANDIALLTTAGSLNVHVDNGTANATEAANYATGGTSVAQTIDFLQVYNVGGSGTWGRLTAGQALRSASLPVTLASDQPPIAINHLQINGWPIPAGVGPSTPGVQRVALSRDSIVTATANESVYTPTGWRGVTGLALGAAIAPTMAIVDASGNQITSFGGGSQFGMGTAQASTANGTIALGYDGTTVRGLSTNASGHLNVIFPSAQAVTQSAGPWTENITQFGGTNLSTGTGVSGVGIPRVTVASDSSLTANAGTNLNTSALALSLTQTDRTQKTQLTDGTRDGTIKAASTAAAAADTSYVVALSPNSPLPAGTAVIGHVITDTTSTTAVTQATASNLNAQVQGAAASGAAKAGNPLQDGGVFNTTQPTVTTGQAVEAQYTARGGAIVATGVDPFTVAGTVTTTPPSNATTNVTQFGSNNVATGTGAGGVGIPRVTVSNDSNVLVTQSTSPWVENVSQFGGSAVSLGKQLASNSIPVVHASDDPVLAALYQLALTLRTTTNGKAGFLGSFGRPITSTGDALDVNIKYPSASADPCTANRKLSIPINQTTGTQLLTGTGGRYYVCAIELVTATAQNVALVDGTGSVCGTGPGGVLGGSTAATGWNFAANGGIALGNGGAMVGAQPVSGNNVCLLQSGAGQVSGNLVVAVGLY